MTRNMVRWLALVVLVMASVAAAQTAMPPQPRVAIVPGVSVNVDAARVDMLSQDLAAALSTELVVDAFGGLEVRRLLPADGLPADCVTTPACTADVARRTGATELIFVVVVDSGASGSIQIDATWVDPSSGKSASRPAIDLATAAEAKAKFTAAASILLPDATVRAKAAVPPSGEGLHARMTDGMPRHFTTPVKVTAGVAGVGLGAGIAFGLAARSKFRACERDALACTDDRKTTIRVLAATADIGFVVAIGGAVASAILYARSAEAPRVILAPSGDGATVTAFGRF